MRYYRIPPIIPWMTIVWLDFEGVIVKKNISYYLLFYDPFLTCETLLAGLNKAFCNKIRDWKKDFCVEVIRESKRHYKRRMGPIESYRFGQWLFQIQPEEDKKNLMDLLKVLLIDDGYDVYVITSADRQITLGFLESLPQDLYIPPEKIFASTDKEYLDRHTKAAIVRELKNKTNKTIIGFGDTKEDEKALLESDVPCVISSFPYLIPPKIQNGFKFHNLYEVKEFFDNIRSDFDIASLYKPQRFFDVRSGQLNKKLSNCGKENSYQD